MCIVKDSRVAEPDDEIELIDLIRILYKRRRMILMCTVLATLLALGTSLLLPPKYNVSFLLELGHDEQGQAIVSPQAVKVAIENDAYGAALRKQLSLNAQEKFKFSIQTPKNTELLYVAYTTSHPDLGLKLLQQLLQLIEVDVEKKLEQKKGRIANEISLARLKQDSFKQKIDLLTTQIKQQKQSVEDLNKTRQGLFTGSNSDPIALLLYSNEIKNCYEYLNQLNDKLTEKRSEVMEVQVEIAMLRTTLDNLQSLYAYKKPTISEKPVSPKKALIVAVGFLLGLGSSVLWAFWREYLYQHPLN